MADGVEVCGLFAVVVVGGCWCCCVWGWGVGVGGFGGGGGVSCANGQLRAEQPYGLRLPDCRAYEMVSPLGRVGMVWRLVIVGLRFRGSGYLFFSGVFSGLWCRTGGCSDGKPVSGAARLGGWSTEDITPPYETFTPQTQTPFEELLFSPELSAGSWKSGSLLW